MNEFRSNALLTTVSCKSSVQTWPYLPPPLLAVLVVSSIHGSDAILYGSNYEIKVTKRNARLLPETAVYILVLSLKTF